MPRSFDLVAKLRAAGVAAVISGAGPSVLVLHSATASEHEDMVKSAGNAFQAMDLDVSQTGAETANA